MLRAALPPLLTCVLAAGQAPGDHAAPGACARQGAESGTCDSKSSGTTLMQQASTATLAARSASETCPASTNTDLYVTSCGDGYSLPSWTDSTLNADCVDGLSFGREVGMICRNVDFSVGKGIIVVHGSGSDRTEMWSANGGWGNLFLQRGYVVFSIDYLTTGDCEVDIANASTFLQDPANLPSADFAVGAGVGVFGFSYGGICAARASIFESAAQEATVCLSGGARNSPARDSHSGMPPVLLLWGNEDCTQDIEYADNWYEKMTNRGLEMTYHVFDGGMSNPHTRVYQTYPCSQEWTTDFFDEKLGVTLEAPTMPPTPTAPTTAPTEAASVSWNVHTEDAKCNNGASFTASDLQACLDTAASNGVAYASFRASDNKCKAAEATCSVRSKNGWTIYEAATPAPTVPPTEPPTVPPTEPPTPAPTPAPTPLPTEPPTEPPALPLEYFHVAANHVCSEGSGTTVADEAACIALAEAGAFQYYSYRGYDTKCKTTSTCTLSAKNHWNIYELGR